MRVQTQRRIKIYSVICVVLSMMALAGCSWLHNRDASADSVVIPRTESKTDTRHESCVRACNHDHDICNDGPASRSQTFDAPQAFVGAGAACDESLRDCLRTCR